MRKFLLLGSLAAMACSAPALAEGLSYTYVEGSYISNEIDDFDIDGDGFGLFGSLALGKSFYAFVSYADSDYDFGVGSQVLEIGGGTHFPLSSSVDLIGAAAYVNASVDVSGFGSASEDGYLLATGLRAALGEKWELHGTLEYVDVGNDDTGVVLGARYYVMKALALGVDYAHNGDGDSWAVALRYDFGK